VTEPDDGKEEEFVDDFGLKQDKESTSFKENDRMVKTLTSSLDVVEAFPPQYVNDRRCTLAVSFANAMQSNSKDLIRTQSSLRQSMQNVMDVLAYAPAKFDNTEQENRWNVIHKCGDNIRAAVIQLMDAGAEFFGFLMILDFGLSYFHSSIINGKGTLDIAISKFAKAAKEFEEYQEKFTKEIAVVRKASKQSMSEISRTFGGEKLIKEAQEALEKHQKELFAALQELKKLEYEKVKELMPLNMEIAALKGDLEQYNLQERFADGDIEDLQSEISNARSRAQAMNRQAESASNYSTSTTTRYRSGGWWWWRYSYSYSYTTTRHTGNKDRLQGIADRYKKLQQEAQNAKEAKQKIMEQARHDKVKAQGEIAAKQKALDAKKESHEKIIKEQDKEVQLAKQRYEAGLKIISDAVKKFGGTETSVVNFLKATQQLGPATMMVLQATKTMDVNIKRLGEMITSQCETVWSIKTYFQRPDVNLVNMIEPLREENFVTLGDLEMNEAEFEEEILPLVKAKGKVADRRKIKKICTDKKEIKKWKQSEKTLGQNNTANLMLQVPVLCIFFPSLHRRLKFAWNTLANFKKEDNKAILSTLNEEIKQLCDAETAKIAAIQFKQYESDTKAIKAREEKGDDESSDDVVRKSKKDKKQTKKKKKRSRDSSSDESDSSDSSESDSDDSAMDIINTKDICTSLALSIGYAVETDSKDLVEAQSIARKLLQHVANVMKYAPTVFENEEQKQRWDLIHHCAQSIRHTADEVNKCVAQWLDFLRALHYGMTHFLLIIHTMNDMNGGQSAPQMANSKLNAAIAEFEQFQQEMTKTALRYSLYRFAESANDIPRTFGGEKQIRDAQHSLDRKLKEYKVALQKLKQYESQKAERLKPVRMEIARLNGDLGNAAPAKNKQETQHRIEQMRKQCKSIESGHQSIIDMQTQTVKRAKERWDACETLIAAAVKKFCVNEHSVANFLHAVEELAGAALMNVIGAIKIIEVNMRRSAPSLRSLCETVLTVSEYLERDDVGLQHMIEPLENAKFLTMRDLEMDEDEFEHEIKPLVTEHGKGADARKLERLCCKKTAIKTWKAEQRKLARISRRNLMMQIPVLHGFFLPLHARLGLVCNDQQLSNYPPRDVQQCAIEMEKMYAVYKALAYEMNEAKKKRRKSKKGSKLLKETLTLVEILFIQSDMVHVRCLNADFEKVEFEIDGDEWTHKLKELLKKGAKGKVDVKLTVTSIANDDDDSKEYKIFDAYLAD